MERATPPTSPTEPGSASDPVAGTPAEAPRDLRAVIVACSGLAAIVLIVVIGAAALPDGRAATGGEGVVAIATAAVTAVGTVVAAYFGVRAANVAREESTKAVERGQIYASELASTRPEEAASAAERADRRIRSLGLTAGTPVATGRRRRRS